jgi:hypothetical protein
MRAIVGALCAGCAAHVQLAAPPADAPEAARVAAYAQLRPTEVTSGPGRHKGLVDPHAILGDGTRVELASDLAPLVSPGSPTATWAAANGAAHRSEHRWMMVAFGAMAAMAGGSAVEIAEIQGERHTYEAVGATVLVTAIVFAWAGWHHGAAQLDSYESQRAAFAHYDDDLRARLAVCVDGLRVIGCAP